MSAGGDYGECSRETLVTAINLHRRLVTLGRACSDLLASDIWGPLVEYLQEDIKGLKTRQLQATCWEELVRFRDQAEFTAGFINRIKQKGCQENMDEASNRLLELTEELESR